MIRASIYRGGRQQLAELKLHHHHHRLIRPHQPLHQRLHGVRGVRACRWLERVALAREGGHVRVAARLGQELQHRRVAALSSEVSDVLA